MSVFIEECFLFLRDPRGGVEDLQAMKAAGFGGVFCNIKDHPPDAWEETVRPRALSAGMFCGPWGHTRTEYGEFDFVLLDRLMYCADDWGSPVIVNSESELKGSGAELTNEIAATVGKRDAAISMEPIPFANVDWTPVAHLPVLPQCFGPDFANAEEIADLWHQYGVKCVFPTFGTYSGWKPDLYPLVAPYSLYTADDCGNNFKPWSPIATGFPGCVETPVPPDGGGMEQIGSQHGITGFANWLRSQPDAPQRGPNYNADDVNTWPWPDKIERTLNILAADHDASQTVFDEPL